MAERLQPQTLQKETNEYLDLTVRKNWIKDNAEMVAQQLGIVCDEIFEKEYGKFLKTVVAKAQVGDHLSALARGQFRAAGCKFIKSLYLKQY